MEVNFDINILQRVLPFRLNTVEFRQANKCALSGLEGASFQFFFKNSLDFEISRGIVTTPCPG